MTEFANGSEPAKVVSGMVRGHEKSTMRTKHMDRVFRDMWEISDDPTGSDPKLYLSKADAITCKEFVEWANDDENGWPSSDTIAMQKCWIPGIPAWRKRPSLNTVKSGLTKALFFHSVGDVHRGYQFGRLGIDPTQPVALCDDGLLRSLRGRELRTSKAIGWGCLPKPEFIAPALSVGTSHGVEYNNTQSLSEALLARTPAAIHVAPAREDGALWPFLDESGDIILKDGDIQTDSRH